MKKLIAAIFLFVASSVANGAVITSALGEFDPVANGYSINSNPGAGWARGWVFDVTASDVWVVELGLHTPSVQARGFTINLWDVNTQSLLASTAATDTSSSWQWFDVTATMLQMGGRYLISLYSEPDNAYYFDSSPLPATASGIDYVTQQYCNGCTNTTFPTSTLSNYQYGLVDFRFQIGEPDDSSDVSEPALLAVLGLGLVLLRRRMK